MRPVTVRTRSTVALVPMTRSTTACARTARSCNLGLISWFNDGADPNFERDLRTSATTCSPRPRTRSRASVTTSCRPTISTTSPTTSSPAVAGNDQVEGGAGNDVFHEGSAAKGSDAMEGDAGADTADYSQRTNPVTVSSGRQFQRRRGRRGRQRRGRPVQQRRHRACAHRLLRRSAPRRDRTIQGDGINAFDLCG